LGNSAKVILPVCRFLELPESHVYACLHDYVGVKIAKEGPLPAHLRSFAGEKRIDGGRS
jgi:hypothetical protein